MIEDEIVVHEYAHAKEVRRSQERQERAKAAQMASEMKWDTEETAPVPAPKPARMTREAPADPEEPVKYDKDLAALTIAAGVVAGLAIARKLDEKPTEPTEEDYQDFCGSETTEPGETEQNVPLCAEKDDSPGDNSI